MFFFTCKDISYLGLSLGYTFFRQMKKVPWWKVCLDAIYFEKCCCKAVNLILQSSTSICYSQVIALWWKVETKGNKTRVTRSSCVQYQYDSKWSGLVLILILPHSLKTRLLTLHSWLLVWGWTLRKIYAIFDIAVLKISYY